MLHSLHFYLNKTSIPPPVKNKIFCVFLGIDYKLSHYYTLLVKKSLKNTARNRSSYVKGRASLCSQYCYNQCCGCPMLCSQTGIGHAIKKSTKFWHRVLFPASYLPLCFKYIFLQKIKVCCFCI